jgi:hypothetical protein
VASSRAAYFRVSGLQISGLRGEGLGALRAGTLNPRRVCGVGIGDWGLEFGV